METSIMILFVVAWLMHLAIYCMEVRRQYFPKITTKTGDEDGSEDKCVIRYADEDIDEDDLSTEKDK
ncbi:MAG: hypothetical protein RR922_03355 [Clostridia bacterium]